MPKIARKPKAPAITPPGHLLSNLMPEPWYGEDYVGRKVAGVQDMAVFDIAAQMQHNVILAGPTGSSKTSAVYAWAAGWTGATGRKRVDGDWEYYNKVDTNRARPLVYIPCNAAADPSIFTGDWKPRSDGSGYRFVPSDVLYAIICGGVLVLDEVNMMKPNIAVYTYALLDKRRVIEVADAAGSGLCPGCAHINEGAEDFSDCTECGTNLGNGTLFEAHEDFCVFATYNPNYIGTKPLSEAFLNRFAINLTWDYDENVEDQLVFSETLLVMARQWRRAVAMGEIMSPVSTNMLMEFVAFAQHESLGLNFAILNLLNKFRPEERPVLERSIEANMAGLKSDLLGEDAEDPTSSDPDSWSSPDDEEDPEDDEETA
jgi:MoxR-like ATPase